VAELNVTEVGGERANGDARSASGGAVEAGTGETGASDQGRIALIIDVRIPNRMFLRGRGLDTEWQGDLAVRGTAASPVITGDLTAVRGRIDALSKTFRLESGQVGFDGGEIDPAIDMTAVHTSENLEVTVNVTGAASKPDFTLSSRPDLPQDEILARLLFGKEVTDLSAGQAAQLAAAVAEFSGATGSGPGMLEKLRRGLGVDVLQFGAGDGTSVRAGQYLTEDVFIGVEQGMTQESGKVTVEVGITDNIAVESNVGATGNSNVGLQFKWDY
jgi:translocation and assembly module TamB